MEIKWVGAVLIILSCGFLGMTLSGNLRREELELKQLIWCLNYMSCELEYRVTSLPELCRNIASHSNYGVHAVFDDLAKRLMDHECADVSVCMNEVLLNHRQLSPSVRSFIGQLGLTLGLFDLPGQIKNIAQVEESCRKKINELQKDKKQRLKYYQTLSLCAGLALAVLLL